MLSNFLYISHYIYNKIKHFILQGCALNNKIIKLSINQEHSNTIQKLSTD